MDEIERIVYHRKVVSRALARDGTDKVVSVGERVITVSPAVFCKVGSEFVESTLMADPLLAKVSMLVMSELMKGRFGNEVYLDEFEGFSKYAFRKGLKLAVAAGLLESLGKPHWYRVNRTYIQYGKEKR